MALKSIDKSSFLLSVFGTTPHVHEPFGFLVSSVAEMSFVSVEEHGISVIALLAREIRHRKIEAAALRSGLE